MRTKESKTGNQPYIPLYIGDWEKDTNTLSLEAEGGWLKIIFKMFTTGGTGVYKISTKALHRLWGKPAGEVQDIIQELLDADVCIIERYDAGYIFKNRRMMKQKYISEIRTNAVQTRYKDDTNFVNKPVQKATKH